MSDSMAIFNIFGTETDDDLIGTGRSERIWGFGGRDRIYAKDGNDTLYGGDGDDLLDGGAGRDAMYGGSGNDLYRVDDAGDLVSEETTPGVDDGGTDTVQTTISFALGSYLDKIDLRGDDAIDAAGNDLKNVMKGNDAANVIFGGGGSDTIYGYGGDDILIGGEGKDYYRGGAGADTFVLTLEPGAWDRIYDFDAEDRIGIYATEFGLAEGAGLTGGVLSADYFTSGPEATASGHGQFVYDAADSELLWDPDGAGGAGSTRITLVDASTPLTASQIVALPETASVSVSLFEAAPRAEDSGPIYFMLELSDPLNEDVVLTCSTVAGTASEGQDYDAISSVEVTITAGSTFAYVPVDLFDDLLAEGAETFSLRIDDARTGGGAPLAIDVAQAAATIVDEGPRVFTEHDTVPLGMTDPAAIAYDPKSNTLFMADSEVDEDPFFQSDNFFALELDGSLTSRSRLNFTDEPTGLAIDADSGRLFITDDDEYRVFCVDKDKPNKVLWDFDTVALGGNDPEDIAFDPVTGNLFICNGLDRTIIEVDQHGTTQIDSFVLPSEIFDPEALVFDAREDVFYIGGGFSANIWKVDRDGEVLDVITTLEDARNAENNHRVSVKDLEFAPASDGSGEMQLYVADYGWSHEADGRLIELDMGDTGWAVA